MGGALLAIEHARHRTALDRHPVGNAAAGIGKQRFDGVDRITERGRSGQGRWPVACMGGGKRHNWLR